MNGGHPWILADKLRYKQIFFNLLSNAIKYTPEGGQVEFVSEAMEAPKGFAGIRSYVRDTGIGMSKEYMEHLYEPFTRDNNAVINKTEGSGLGLAIVKNIVDAMGGTIHVNSELGKGTEFIVDLCLPIAAESKQPEMEASLSNEKILEGKHILLVEDNAVNTRIAVKLLQKKGCIVSTAINGQEAVNLFSEAGEKAYDAILMDIRMPVMDGLTAAKTIRALKRKDALTIPMIAMTANAYIEDIQMSKDAGMNAHLSKPIEPEKMFHVLAQWLKRSENDA